MGMTDFVLRVEDIHLNFGGVGALSGVSLEVERKEIPSVRGPNGTGKTCLLNSINGFYKPQEGGISFEDQDVTPIPCHRVSEMGIARTFQNLATYGGLSVIDNIASGRPVFMKRG
jgi:branched-chain amino acid transport system ATP-binding protein